MGKICGSDPEVDVRVSTMDVEMEFSILHSTTGKTLFEKVTKLIGLQETWFFGLQYTSIELDVLWLEFDKKVLNQRVKTEYPLRFNLRAKYFPECVSELQQEITQKLFYLQVKDTILNNIIRCPEETSLLLASYACQAKFGDYKTEIQKPHFLVKEKILPEKLYHKQDFTNKFEETIIKWYKEHKGLQKEDAMLEYLKLCQDLEMYGVNYFKIQNKKGTDLLLGVDALGINIYEKSDKLAAKICFPWSEIQNISYKKKKFTIKPLDKGAPDFSFYAPHVNTNQMVLDLCMGNHDLYMRRRKPDTVEVEVIKRQVQEDKIAKQTFRAELELEKEKRHAAERRMEELEELLEKYKKENESLRKDMGQLTPVDYLQKGNTINGTSYAVKRKTSNSPPRENMTEVKY